jgi:hypothetical protein
MATNTGIFPSDLFDRLLQEITETLRTGKLRGKVTMRGDFEKQGNIYKTWKRRHFVIVNDAILLYFKKKGNNLEPKGGAVLVGSRAGTLEVKTAVHHYSSHVSSIPDNTTIAKVGIKLTTIVSITWNSEKPQESTKARGRVFQLKFLPGMGIEDKLRWIRPDRYLYRSGLINSPDGTTPAPKPDVTFNLCVVICDREALGEWNWCCVDRAWYECVEKLEPSDMYTRINFKGYVEMLPGNANTQKIAKADEMIGDSFHHRGRSVLLDALRAGIRTLRTVHEALSASSSTSSSASSSSSSSTITTPTTYPTSPTPTTDMASSNISPEGEGEGEGGQEKGPANDTSTSTTPAPVRSAKPVTSLLVALCGAPDRGSKTTHEEIIQELSKCPSSDHFKIILFATPGHDWTGHKIEDPRVSFRYLTPIHAFPAMDILQFAIEDRVNTLPESLHPTLNDVDN